MNPTLPENVDYHHKKFDQSKRRRTDSLSSSSADSGSIKLENEAIIGEKGPCYQTSNENTSSFHSPLKNSSRKRSNSAIIAKDISRQQATAKRSRFNSVGSTNIRQNISTPLNVVTAAATVVPPTAAILPKINKDTLHSICKYHGNMVRKFPKKERTPKDQERRNKNTIACRMSRRVKKLEHVAIEEQYKEFSQQTFYIMEQSIRASTYLKELMKLNPSFYTLVHLRETQTLNMFAAVQQQKEFTIEYLTRMESKLKQQM